VTEPPRQLVLDFPFRQALGDTDFVVSGSNSAAVRMIDSWPNWPAPILILLGPEGSGKTHLTHVWQAQSQAERLPASELAQYQPDHDKVRPLVIEDGDRGIADERNFFHALNLARQTGTHVLVTGRSAPAEWGVTLPDLASRLLAAPVVRLGPVDDMLLRAVLVKLFSDRQLPATPAAVAHLARHMERSMAAALAVVEQIDAMAWERRGGVTRALANAALLALETHQGSGDDAPDHDQERDTISHNPDTSQP
jgi:chromosomal replication initiation ATPase DnaA